MRVFLLKTFDSASCIDQLLLASKEWMAARADFQTDLFAGGGARFPLVTASTVDFYNLVVRMNAAFHVVPSKKSLDYAASQ